MTDKLLTNEPLAIEAYKAYGKTTDFKNYQGLPMPEWENLTPKIREAWIAAVTRVKEIVQEPDDVAEGS